MKELEDKIEYFIFTNPTDTFWKGTRELVCEGKYGWYKYGNHKCFNDYYQKIIPNNIRLATKEELEYGFRNQGKMNGFITQEDKIIMDNETEKKERELLKQLLKKYPN